MGLWSTERLERECSCFEKLVSECVLPGEKLPWHSEVLSISRGPEDSRKKRGCTWHFHFVCSHKATWMLVRSVLFKFSFTMPQDKRLCKNSLQKIVNVSEIKGTCSRVLLQSKERL